MMSNLMKVLIVIGVIVFLFTGMTFNPGDQGKVFWKEGKKLTWFDFQGTPDRSTNLMAMTDCQMSFEFNSGPNGEAVISVISYFDQTKSWTKDKESKALLAHEQLHFDICELYTRIAKKRLSVYKKMDKASLNKMKSETSKVIAEFSAEEKKYDKETNHGLLENKQKEWSERIPKLIKQYEAYK